MSTAPSLLAGDVPGDRRREIVTPEGVPLHVMVASAGDRAGAFLIDCLTMFAILLGVGFIFGITAAAAESILLLAVLVVLQFLIVFFYFPFFEIRWQGRTPGKRLLGLRVIDRHGGRLTGEAVFARNLTRQLELLVPLVALLQPQALWAGASGWLTLVCGLWLLIVLLLPLFNRDRLRIGDLVAGTLVIRNPKPRLLRDLADRSTARDPAPRHHFTAEQLDYYGIYELQVLEGLLRERKPDRRRVQVVADKIQQRIGWDPEERVQPLGFLRDFYAAQRARLEHQLLLGDRRERKQPRGGHGDEGKPGPGTARAATRTPARDRPRRPPP